MSQITDNLVDEPSQISIDEDDNYNNNYNKFESMIEEYYSEDEVIEDFEEVNESFIEEEIFDEEIIVEDEQEIVEEEILEEVTDSFIEEEIIEDEDEVLDEVTVEDEVEILEESFIVEENKDVVDDVVDKELVATEAQLNETNEDMVIEHETDESLAEMLVQKNQKNVDVLQEKERTVDAEMVLEEENPKDEKEIAIEDEQPSVGVVDSTDNDENADNNNEKRKVERWISRNDDEPEDFYDACYRLICVVYKDEIANEEVEPESMMRRSPLPELYRYLKQHYWYKVHSGELDENAIHDVFASQQTSVKDAIASQTSANVAQDAVGLWTQQEESRKREEEEARRREEEAKQLQAARQKEVEEARRREEEQSLLEEEAREKAEEEERLRAEEGARQKEEEAARLRAEEEARQKEEEEARLRAEEVAQRNSEEDAEEEAQQKEEEEAQPTEAEEVQQREILLADAKIPIMYLPHEQWSPRFEDTFFTIKMGEMEHRTSPPPNNSTSSDIGGKTSFPAYYYKVEIRSAHNTQYILRRYSQFYWLYQQLCWYPPEEQQEQPQPPPPLIMPPGTCFLFFQNDSFARNRLEQLRDFLRDVLERPGHATHPAVAKFLELDQIHST